VNGREENSPPDPKENPQKEVKRGTPVPSPHFLHLSNRENPQKEVTEMKGEMKGEEEESSPLQPPLKNPQKEVKGGATAPSAHFLPDR
jgi:hypothetical protein